MNQPRKDEISYLVDIYLNDLVSVKYDAGWTGESILSRLITFRGDLPEPTRNDQSNLAMINAIELLREDHERLPDIKAALYTIKPHYSLAICAKRFYVGLYLPEDGNPREAKEYSDADRARLIGQQHKSFERNVRKAYEKLDEILQVLELRREFQKSAA